MRWREFLGPAQTLDRTYGFDWTITRAARFTSRRRIGRLGIHGMDDSAAGIVGRGNGTGMLASSVVVDGRITAIRTQRNSF